MTLPLAFLVLIFLGNPASAAEQYWEYTVRPGDNIWNLTKQHCTSVRYWQQIQKLNKIDLDHEIPPGTRLRFPLSILKHQPATALVAQLQGSAELLRAGASNAIPLQAETSLRSGDRITTGPDSNLTLQFADGSQLLVLADSQVVMDSLSAWGTTGMVDTRIRLQGGRVDTLVKPASGPGSRYQIITPAAVAAVRGTAFRVAAESGKPVMRSEVTAGAVGVGNADKSTSVPAGFGLVAEAGKLPDAPRELLPAVDLSRLPVTQRQLPLNFSWPAVDGAHGYRIQIAPDIRFNSLLVDTTTEKAEASREDLPDGRYALRIRGIDAVGLEGLDGIHQFKVDARPFPPAAATPANNSAIRDSNPVFNWSVDQVDRAYRIQIAHDEDFSDLVIDQTVEAASYRQEQPLAAGIYHWRVAVIGADGEQGPFDASQNFTYRQPLSAPLLLQPFIDRTHLTLSWEAVNDAESYQLQVATDPDFTDLKVDRQQPDLQVDIPRPPSQMYYLRVRALNPAGAPGPYSAPRELYVPSLYPWWPLILAAPLLLAL